MDKKAVTLIMLLVFSITGFSKNTHTHAYKNLVFEGGGIRGLVYCGALIELEERGILDSVIRVGGTSSGAINAMLLALGYSPLEIKKIIYNTNIASFNDGQFFFLGGIKRLIKNYGWYRGKKIENFFHKVIENKTGNGNITFIELHENKEKYGNKDLYIVATCLTHQKEIVFSYESFPNMKIKDALRASISIPLYFKAVFITDSGEVIHKNKTDNATHLLVDGGVSNNFPLHIFDYTQYLDTTDTLMMNKTVYNPETLGLLIETDIQIKYDKSNQGLAPQKISNIKDYMVAFYTITIETINRKNITETDWDRIILLSTGSFGPKIKKMSNEDKNILIQNGMDGVVKFFNE